MSKGNTLPNKKPAKISWHNFMERGETHSKLTI